MKNIKKYTEFLLEYDAHFDTRSKPVRYGQKKPLLDLIKEKAPWYYENIDNITPIYRGLMGKRYWKNNAGDIHRVLQVSPSEHTRYARNTDNHYIEIIDNSEYWSEYPKRSKSIICSFSKVKAKGYGRLYRVIPIEENSKLAICPKDDVFFSFPVLFENLEKINDTRISNIAAFNEWLNFGFGIPEDVDRDFIWGRVNSVVDELQDTDPEHFNEDDSNYEIKRFAKKLVNDELHYDDFFLQLEDWMEPEANGFKLVEYNRNSTDLGKMNEVYTDAKCLLILESDLEKELEERENKKV